MRALALFGVASLGVLLWCRSRSLRESASALASRQLRGALAAFAVGVGLQVLRQWHVEREFFKGRYHEAVAQTDLQAELFRWICLSAIALATVAVAVGVYQGVSWAKVVLFALIFAWGVVGVLLFSGGLPRPL